MRRLLIGLVLASLTALAALNPSDVAARQQPGKGKAGPDPKAQWNKAADQAIAFLKSNQAANGTWGGQSQQGVTGIAVLGLLRTGKVTADDPAIARALKYIESLADPATGHIAGADARGNLFNYCTSVNIMALAATGQAAKYQAFINKAAGFLKEIQVDESEGKALSDPAYGGAGYGANSRPDLSNTHFYLDALATAGVPKSDPVFKKAVVYVSRVQNFKSEHNTQPWAGTINDGSFIYTASGDTRGDTTPDGRKPGYGSMTYAGLKGLLVCGVPKDDPRCRKAMEWLRAHYTVDVNPGMAQGSGGRGLYYYLLTMAECLTVVGEPTFTDDRGVAHDWQADIRAALTTRQRRDGSWQNDTNAWMETDAQLCTAYSLITLGYVNP